VGSDALGGDEDSADVGLEALDLDLSRELFADLVFLVACDSEDEELHGGWLRLGLVMTDRFEF
jgi:hypothetical protein